MMYRLITSFGTYPNSKNSELYTFMIKLTIKNSKLSGYTWANNKDANLDCFVEVKAETLKEAIDILEKKYDDKNKYWIKPEESYMILKL